MVNFFLCTLHLHPHASSSSKAYLNKGRQNEHEEVARRNTAHDGRPAPHEKHLQKAMATVATAAERMRRKKIEKEASGLIKNIKGHNPSKYPRVRGLRETLEKNTQVEKKHKKKH